MLPEELLEPPGDDVAAVGDEEAGLHAFLGFVVHGGEEGVDGADGHAGHGLVGRVFGEPGEVLVEELAVALVEQVDEVHLPDDGHAPLALVEAVDEGLVVFAVHAEPLVAGDGAGFGQGGGGELEEGFADGDVDVDGALAVVAGFEQGLVDEAAAMPFVLLGADFGQVGRHFHEGAEHAGLRHRLPVHLAEPCGGAVGGQDDERHLLVEGFGHGGVEVEQGGA